MAEGEPPYESHGPIQGAMPIFGPDGGEIMTTEDGGNGFVQMYVEDSDDPQILHPVIISREDFEELRLNQPNYPL